MALIEIILFDTRIRIGSERILVVTVYDKYIVEIVLRHRLQRGHLITFHDSLKKTGIFKRYFRGGRIQWNIELHIVKLNKETTLLVLIATSLAENKEETIFILPFIFRHTDELKEVGLTRTGLTHDKVYMAKETILEDNGSCRIRRSALDKEPVLREATAEYIGKINPLIPDIPKPLHIHINQFHPFPFIIRSS